MEIKLNVVIVTAAVTLQLKPGDRVMVYNNQILGHAPAAPKLDVAVLTQSEVVAALTPRPNGLNVRTLADEMQIPRDDGAKRRVLGEFVRELVKKKVLEYGETDSPRYPVFKIKS